MLMKKKDTLLKLVLALIIIIIILLFFRYSGILRHGKMHTIRVHDFKRFLLKYGKWSALVFILIYSLKPVVLVIPASLLSIVCGVLYGPFYGTIYTMLGAFFAATIAFYIARFLGKNVVDKILKGKTQKLDENIEKNGFQIMLLMRLAFIFPYDPLSYAAGLSKIKYRDFILGTCIGVFPEMILYNYLGKNIHHPFNPQTILGICVIIIIAVIAFFIKKKLKKA